MQGFSIIIGQPGAVGALKSAIDTSKIVHCYLFTGPRGIGKRLTASIFARALNCEGSYSKPCDYCLPCQKALHQNHPDIIFLKPDGISLKIEQVRALKKMAYTRVYEGQYKVFIIEDMHKATVQANNSLLKILEEPPENSVFILLSENPQAMPATIVSRCQRVNFAPLEKSSISEILLQKGYPLEKAQLAANLAFGSLGQALRFIDNEQLMVTRRIASEFLQGALSNNHYRTYKIIETLEKDKVDVGQLLEQILVILRDIYFYTKSKSGDIIVNLDMLSVFQSLAVGEQNIKRAMEMVSEASEFQRKQANSKILLEVLGCRLTKLA